VAAESPLVKKTRPARYGFAMFGTSIPINMFKSFAAIYYVDSLGLDMKKYSLVLFIYTFVDAIDNPVYGFLSDRTRTKWGRRRPWLLIGTPLLVLFFILFYNVPGFVQSEKGTLFIYMLLMYILTGTLDSLVNANYGALFPELFRTDVERAKVNGFRQICQLFAMAISIALTPMIAGKLGYRTTSVVYGALALIVMMYCFWGCREDLKYIEESEKPNLFSSIWALLSNPKFWIFGFVGAFYSAAFSLISQAVPFYVKYTLKLSESMTTVMLGVVLVVAVAAIIIWSKIVKKWTVMKVWRTGLLIMALSFVPMFFINSFIPAIIAACFVGFGVGACLTTMDCIGAKIVDDDFVKHGIKREGIINSLMGVMNRLNGLYTSLAFYIVSETFNFVNGDNPGENPAMAARVLLCVFPAAAMILATVIALFLKFPELNKKAEK
jgi:GPH family glycoside/pentoside/hexuronide:cation symporter